jgi:hemerythrin
VLKNDITKKMTIKESMEKTRKRLYDTLNYSNPFAPDFTTEEVKEVIDEVITDFCEHFEKENVSFIDMIAKFMPSFMESVVKIMMDKVIERKIQDVFQIAKEALDEDDNDILH